VGHSVERHGGRNLVRGRPVFAEDDQPKGALVLKVFRSKKHHAKILSIDTAKAQNVRGIAGILTASDIPGVNQYGVIIKDQPLLAKDKVRFAGEAIALVAAENEEAADEALQALDIQFQDLPPVFMKRGTSSIERPSAKGTWKKGSDEATSWWNVPTAPSELSTAIWSPTQVPVRSMKRGT
jgi:xanthine dehydrogenase molybdopterin-binding subunit B